MLERQSPWLFQTQNTPGKTSKETAGGGRERKIQTPSELDSSEKWAAAGSV